MADTPDTPDLNFIDRQLERMMRDVADVRDEQRVQGAMFRRFDVTLSVVREEIRTLRDRIDA
jgi:hypothetical protein